MKLSKWYIYESFLSIFDRKKKPFEYIRLFKTVKLHICDMCNISYIQYHGYICLCTGAIEAHEFRHE